MDNVEQLKKYMQAFADELKIVNVEQLKKDMQAYFVDKFKMPEKVAENFVKIYRSSSKEKRKARGWTIKHPQFVKLAKWWAKRYK